MHVRSQRLSKYAFIMHLHHTNYHNQLGLFFWFEKLIVRIRFGNFSDTDLFNKELMT